MDLDFGCYTYLLPIYLPEDAVCSGCPVVLRLDDREVAVTRRAQTSISTSTSNRSSSVQAVNDS